MTFKQLTPFIDATGQVVETIEQTPATPSKKVADPLVAQTARALNKRQKDVKPHDILAFMGMSDDLVVWDVSKTTSGRFYDLQRRLSVRERTVCLRAAAPYFAPQLRSVEGTLKSDFSGLTADQLQAKAATLLGNIQNSEAFRDAEDNE